MASSKAPGRRPQIHVVVGQRFFRGVVVDAEVRLPPSPSSPYGRRAALLLCDCGVSYTAATKGLVRGYTKSCGCLRREQASVRMRSAQALRWEGSHGLSKHPLYRLWNSIMYRCENPGAAQFPDYGGKGVSVFSQWHDLPTFIKYVEECLGGRPPRTSFDRIVVTGNYEPGNVRWASHVVQQTNKRGRDALLVSAVAERRQAVWDRWMFGLGSEQIALELKLLPGLVRRDIQWMAGQVAMQEDVVRCSD